MDPAFRSRAGDDPADLLLSEASGTLLPLCALAESPGAAFSELKLLRRSRYCSLPLASTGISSQSLSNWQRSRGHLPGLVATLRSGEEASEEVLSSAGVQGPRQMKN